MTVNIVSVPRDPAELLYIIVYERDVEIGEASGDFWAAGITRARRAIATHVLVYHI